MFKRSVLHFSKPFTFTATSFFLEEFGAFQMTYPQAELGIERIKNQLLGFCLLK